MGEQDQLWQRWTKEQNQRSPVLMKALCDHAGKYLSVRQGDEVYWTQGQDSIGQSLVQRDGILDWMPQRILAAAPKASPHWRPPQGGTSASATGATSSADVAVTACSAEDTAAVYRAVADYSAEHNGYVDTACDKYLSFKKDEMVERILRQDDDADWLYVRRVAGDDEGWVPPAYFHVIARIAAPAADAAGQGSDGTLPTTRMSSAPEASKISHEAACDEAEADFFPTLKEVGPSAHSLPRDCSAPQDSSRSTTLESPGPDRAACAPGLTANSCSSGHTMMAAFDGPAWGPDYLTLSEGDVVQIDAHPDADGDWVYGEFNRNGHSAAGWLPKGYLRQTEPQNYGRADPRNQRTDTVMHNVSTDADAPGKYDV